MRLRSGSVVAGTWSDGRRLESGRVRLWVFSGGDHFLLCQGLGVKEGLHRRFAEAPSSLVRPFLVVILDPIIEIALQLADRAVDFLAEGDAVELVERGLVEALTNSMRLRALGFGARVIDILDCEVELILMPLWIAAIFASRGRSVRA